MIQGRSEGGGLGVPVTPPPPFFLSKQHTNLIIQVAKKCESEESTCHKSVLVLGSYILHFQDRTFAVDYVSTLGVPQCDPPLENRCV